MDMIDTRVGVNFCLVRNGQILLQQRDENCPSYPNQWCIPGGGIQEGEEFIETVLREAKEEYDINLNENDCMFLVDRPNFNPGKVYLCNVSDDQEPNLNEGKDMRWVPFDELNKMELAFSHGEIIVPYLLKYLHEHTEEPKKEIFQTNESLGIK